MAGQIADALIGLWKSASFDALVSRTSSRRRYLFIARSTAEAVAVGEPKVAGTCVMRVRVGVGRSYSWIIGFQCALEHVAVHVVRCRADIAFLIGEP